MSVSRRQFISRTAAGVASLGLWSARRAHAAKASDIRLAVIGVNGRGQSHIDGFGKHLVAMCDVDEVVLDQRLREFEEKQGRKLDSYTDYRKLLEREDIDAVSIATPNHTHALIAVAAAQAGKDVYCEKPVSHNIWEGRQIVNAARKFDRIIQCGTQARSSTAIQAAVEFVRSGKLGSIRYAVGTCYKPRPSIGKRDTPLEIPSTVHYDLWCGPAEQEELYRTRLHYDWHWNFNTGNGDTGNQGIHQMDIARWFLGADTLAPRVLSIGGRLGYEDAGNTPNTQIAYYDYPDAPLLFETRGLPRSKKGQSAWSKSMDRYRGLGVGVLIQCDKGTVRVTDSYSRAAAYDENNQRIESWEDRGVSHMDNFIEAVAAQKRSALSAEILEGHLSSALCHQGNISHQVGTKKSAAEIAEFVAGNDLLAHSFDRMASHLRANQVDIDSSPVLTMGEWLELDTKTEMFTNSDAANELRARKQREPFVIPNLESEPTRTAAG